MRFTKQFLLVKIRMVANGVNFSGNFLTRE
jgi:hypothetical protein